MVNLDEMRGALADPDAPWYGSDLVPQVASLIDEVDGFRESMKFVSDIFRNFVDDKTCTTTGDSIEELKITIEELNREIEDLENQIEMYNEHY